MDNYILVHRINPQESANKASVCAKHRMDLLCFRNSIRSLSHDMRRIFASRDYKHSNYILLPKTLGYAFLDSLNSIADDMSSNARNVGFKSSGKTDSQVAYETIDRILEHANEDPTFPVTVDEAENLRKLFKTFRKNYTKE